MENKSFNVDVGNHTSHGVSISAGMLLSSSRFMMSMMYNFLGLLLNYFKKQKGHRYTTVIYTWFNTCFCFSDTFVFWINLLITQLHQWTRPKNYAFFWVCVLSTLGLGLGSRNGYNTLCVKIAIFYNFWIPLFPIRAEIFLLELPLHTYSMVGTVPF